MSKNLQPGEADGGAGGGVSSKIEAIAARAGVGGQPQGGEGGDIDEQTDQKFTVDLGDGVQREVTLTELTTAFNSQEKVKAAQSALEQRVAELGDLNSVKRLREQIEALDPQGRQKVMAILSGQVAGDDDEDDLDEEVARQVFGKRERNGKPAQKVDPDLMQKLGFLENVVMSLAKRENTRIESEQRQTLGNQVDAEMANYPIFKDPVVAAMARDSVMLMLAQDDQSEPAKVVRSAAGKLHKLMTERRQAAAEEIGVPRTMVQGEDRKSLNAEGLRTGVVRRLAEKFLAGQ